MPKGLLIQRYDLINARTVYVCCVIDMKTFDFSKKLPERPNKVHYLTFSLLWVFMGLLLHSGIKAQRGSFLPQGVHAWAQADRYALALNYYEHGLKFNEARTQYLGSKDARVGVEFPMIPFIAAGVCKLGSLERDQLPEIFRWTNWFFLGLGALGIYLMLYHKLKRPLHSALLSMFVLSSPVVIYYGFGFAPDSAALGLVLLAFYFAEKSIRTEAAFTAIVSIGLLAIATLVKVSSGIFLLSIGGSTVLYFLSKKKRGIAAILFLNLILMCGIIGWYDYYQVYKVNIDHYAAIFMSKTHPVESFSEWRSIFKGMRQWNSGYFTQWQYGLLALTLLYFGIRKNIHLKAAFTSWEFLVISSSILGIIAYTLLFGKQLPDHDYYFISSFMPLAVIGSTFFIRNQPQGCALNIFLLIGSVFSISSSYDQALLRQEDLFLSGKQEIRNQVDWLKEFRSAEFQQEIPNKVRVFVAYEYEPNLSLVYLNRKGMVFNHEEMARAKHFEYWLKELKPEFIVIQKQWLEQLALDQPELMARLDLYKETKFALIYQTERLWIQKK